MVMFEYTYRNTVLHNLHPLSKVLLLILLATLAIIWMDIRYLIFVLAFELILSFIAKINLRMYLTTIAIASLSSTIGATWVAIFQVNPKLFKVYPHEFVTTTLIQLTPKDFPIFPEAAITYGVLLWWVRVPVMVTCLILAIAIFSSTTSLSSIIYLLRRLKAPYGLIFIITVAYRFIPDLVRKIDTILKAQKLRGWKGEMVRNPIKKGKLYIALVNPLTFHIVKSIDIVTMAVESKAFGSGKYTPLTEFKFSGLDYLVSIFSIVALVLALSLQSMFNVGLL